MICPLHGFVWRKDIGWYLDNYMHWSSYTPEEQGVVIAYASIYGNTANAADVLACRLRERGVPAYVVAKIGEGRPDCLDVIKNREVSLIVNTPSGRRDARADDSRIRQNAIKYKVPYLTTIAAVRAASEGIVAAMSGKGEVRSLQSYHASIGK